MKKLLTLITILTVASSLYAERRWREMNVGRFINLEIENDLSVRCRFVPDSAGFVRYICEESVSDAFIFDRTKKNRLKMMISPDFIDNIPEATIIVYTDSLCSVRSSSLQDVRVEELPPVEKFKAVLIGNGTLTVTGIDCDNLTGVLATGNGTVSLIGKARKSTLKLTGAGQIVAHDLPSDKISCHVLGSGDIICYPIEELVLKGLGSTRVHYRGKPAVIKKSGLGKLMPLDEE